MQYQIQSEMYLSHVSECFGSVNTATKNHATTSLDEKRLGRLGIRNSGGVWGIKCQKYCKRHFFFDNHSTLWYDTTENILCVSDEKEEAGNFPVPSPNYIRPKSFKTWYVLSSNVISVDCDFSSSFLAIISRLFLECRTCLSRLAGCTWLLLTTGFGSST